MPPPARRLWVRGCLVSLAAGAGGYVVATFPPAAHDLYPKCQTYALFGLHCPGCGLTRAAHALLTGDVSQAFAYNLFAPVVLPLAALAAGRALLGWVRGRPPVSIGPPPRWARHWPWVVGGLLAAYAVARNVPAEPFTLLTPHELRR